MTAIDLLTGETFYKKRCNQKFATRRNQIRYNNLKAQKERELKKKIDAPLSRNRRILSKLLGKDNEVIKSRDWLMALGYDFSLYTSTIKLDAQLIPCVYEFCCQKITNDQYKIYRHENY